MSAPQRALSPRGEGQGEGGLATNATLGKTPSPQPSPQGERGQGVPVDWGASPNEGEAA
jgi:hypothetical protein